MKFFIPYLVLFGLMAGTACLAADSSPSPSPSAAPIAYAVSPPLSPSGAIVAVAEPAAPPSWAQDLMVNAQKLPIIGPIVTKGLLYLGIVSAILTSLCGFLIGALNVLSGALQFAGLASAVQKIADFQSGKFMYYLKFFSLFNAKKPDPQ